MFIRGMRELEDKNPAIKETVSQIIRKTVQYINAIPLESKNIDTKNQLRLEMHYQINRQDIMKEIESYLYPIANEPSSNSSSK